MFDIIRRWITVADPVRFAGWCGEPRRSSLSDKLTHEGGSDGDLKVIEFCDETCGTHLALHLHRSLSLPTPRRLARNHFANANERACRILKDYGVTVVDEYGCPLLDEE